MCECVRKSVVLKDWGQEGERKKKEKITRSLLLIVQHVAEKLIEITEIIPVHMLGQHLHTHTHQTEYFPCSCSA